MLFPDELLKLLTRGHQNPRMVVPIPIHVKKLRQRGFNQAEKIAEAFCQVTDYDLQPKILTRVKPRLVDSSKF